jgi:hypothetical protein
MGVWWEWPAGLVLSILAHYFNERHVNTNYLEGWNAFKSKAWKYHHHFKSAFVAGWKGRYWTISSEDIDAWFHRLTAGTYQQAA